MLAAVGLGTACRSNQYPYCKAFEFGDLQAPPRIVDDDDANPVDCGYFRVVGPAAAPVIEGPVALDCALEHLAAGTPMQVELDQEPEDDWGRSAAVFSDDDGTAMRWQSINEDLVTDFEARVLAVDPGRFEACRDLEDAGERYGCFTIALDDGELVKTCETLRLEST